MKDFINKLELAFDKQLVDKTNYGRNQVKELFLRACIEVLADTRISKTPSKEEGRIVGRTNRKVYLSSTFALNAVEDLFYMQYVKLSGDKEYYFEVYANDMEFVCEGWTSIDNPSEEDILQLYNFWVNQLPF